MRVIVRSERSAVGDQEHTPPVRLWGGRFESGPAEVLAILDHNGERTHLGPTREAQRTTR